MENNMFCFQCQETAKGFGCTLKGVCGKNATTARTMDLLLFVVRGISVVADQLRQHSLPVEKEVDNFIKNGIIGIWAGSICLRLSEFSATTQRKVEVGEPF